MSTTFATERLGAVRRALPVPWPTAAVLAVLLCYADGFWLTSLQGAVGAISRNQRPFANWALHSTLMLPVFAVAVVAALAFAQRRFGAAPHTRARTTRTALLVAAAGTLVGVLQTAASTVYDYQLQSAQLLSTEASHFHTLVPDTPGTCGGVCESLNLTFDVDVRGIGYLAVVLLVTDLVIVGWIVAMRGGRLEPRGTERKAR